MSENRSKTKQQSKSQPDVQWDLTAANKLRSKIQQHPPPESLHPIRLGSRSVFQTANDVRGVLKLSETPKTGTTYELRYDGTGEKLVPKHEAGRKQYCLITTASLNALHAMTEYDQCFVSVDNKSLLMVTPTSFKPGQPKKFFDGERKTKATWKDDGERHMVDSKGRTFDDVYGRKR